MLSLNGDETLKNIRNNAFQGLTWFRLNNVDENMK